MALDALANRLTSLAERSGAYRLSVGAPNQQTPECSEPDDLLGNLNAINRRLHAAVQLADLISGVV